MDRRVLVAAAAIAIAVITITTHLNRAVAENPNPPKAVSESSRQPLVHYLGQQPFVPWLDTEDYAAWLGYTVPEGKQAVITQVSCRAHVPVGTKVEFWYRTDLSTASTDQTAVAESCLPVAGRSGLTLKSEPAEHVFGAQHAELYLGPGDVLWVWAFADKSGGNLNCYINGYLEKAK